ncbi:MAG TPA: HIRAN domain-containing protein [Devosiaceae bacterium]|jgi:hypothetical protein|nr:HIRAN domain-containing protein [Devosiaceae bacterium]
MIIRRAFLAGLGGLVALAPMTTLGAVGRRPEEVALPPSYITNLPAELPPAPLAAGAPLRLVREPERPYDPASVAVLAADDSRLGYLPADQSRLLAPLLDAGLPARAEVVAAGTSPRPFVRINLFLGTAVQA